MTIAEITKGLENLSSPFQPFLSLQVENYQEKQIDWNRLTVKSGALCYRFRSPGIQTRCRIQVLPDVCPNIIFKCDEENPEVFFSGPFFKTMFFECQPDTDYFGFKPYSILGLKTKKYLFKESVDTYINFATAYPASEDLMLKIVKEKNFEEQIHLFNDFSEAYMLDHDYHSSFVDYFSAMICSMEGNIIFHNLESIIGYSNRYSREKFKDIHGFSPKKYSEVLRFQRAIKNLLYNNHGDLSDFAVDNGFFDQAHFIHDFKKYSTMTPERFRRLFTVPASK